MLTNANAGRTKLHQHAACSLWEGAGVAWGGACRFAATTLAGGLEVNAKEIQVLICAVLHLRYLCESAERAIGHPAMYPPLEEPKPHCQSVQILRLKG